MIKEFAGDLQKGIIRTDLLLKYDADLIDGNHIFVYTDNGTEDILIKTYNTSVGRESLIISISPYKTILPVTNLMVRNKDDETLLELRSSQEITVMVISHSCPVFEIDFSSLWSIDSKLTYYQSSPKTKRKIRKLFGELYGLTDPELSNFIMKLLQIRKPSNYLLQIYEGKVVLISVLYENSFWHQIVSLQMKEKEYWEFRNIFPFLYRFKYDLYHFSRRQIIFEIRSLSRDAVLLDGCHLFEKNGLKIYSCPSGIDSVLNYYSSGRYYDILKNSTEN